MQVIESCQYIAKNQGRDNFRKAREEKSLDRFSTASKTIKREDDVDIEVFDEDGIDWDDIWMLENF